MQFLTCNVPKGTKRSAFDPFPGSDAALERGCTCPEKQPWPRQVQFASDCPIHQLEHVTQ